MLRKVRTDLDSVKPILEEFYQKGLTGLQTVEQKDMANELCDLTNLKHSQVKDWLSNKRKKMAGITRHKKPKVSLRQKSGRDLFQKDFMKVKPAESLAAYAADDAASSAVGMTPLTQSQIMSESARQWRNVKDTPEGQEYIRKAKLLPPADVAMMNVEQRSSFLNHHYKKLSNLLSVMESAGTETVVFSFNSNDGTAHCFGTDKGLRFKNKRPDLFSCFIAFITDGAAVEVEANELRKKVIDLLDMRYCELTGINKFSFDAVKAGSVVLEGLPVGTKFTNPQTAKKSKLAIILANGEKIKFSRVASANPCPVPISRIDLSLPQAVAQGIPAHATATSISNQVVATPVHFPTTNLEIDPVAMLPTDCVVQIDDSVQSQPTLAVANSAGECFDDELSNPTIVQRKTKRVARHRKADLTAIGREVAKKKNGSSVAQRKRSGLSLTGNDNGESKVTQSSDDSDKQDNVEAIRGSKVKRGKLHYLIKWRDFGEEKNSWEPATNILDANLIALWKRTP